MPHYELDGQGAIVTGSGRSIGRGIALRLGREGASVVVADIDLPSAEAVSKEIQSAGGKAIAVRMDVTRKTDADRVVAETVAAFGRLDILVNNAAIARVKPTLEVEEADWDEHMAVNAKGVLFCSQAAAREMIKQGHGGRIITILSTAARLPGGPTTALGAYVASKHAALGLIQKMSQEMAPHGILMNAVFPGIVDTPMLHNQMRSVAELTGESYQAQRERFQAKILLGRLQQPEDVANMVAFLASSDANYTVGQSFDASGGAFFW